jgi:hypothetical protein
MNIANWITLATRLATLYLLLCIASHVGRPHMSQSSNTSVCDHGSCSGATMTQHYEWDTKHSELRTDWQWWLP